MDDMNLFQSTDARDWAAVVLQHDYPSSHSATWRRDGLDPRTPRPMVANLTVETGAPSARPSLHFSPRDVARRQGGAWGRLAGEIVQVTDPEPFEVSFSASAHLLIAVERGERHDGESVIDGLPPSKLRNMGQKLTFVPAGRAFHEWQTPRILPRMTCLYLDQTWFKTVLAADVAEVELQPRLFFHEGDLWATARKLTRQIEKSSAADQLYVDVLGLVLARELLRLNSGSRMGEALQPGCLAEWQSNQTAEYIEAHLGDQISLATLAAIARLSPYHFARAFKRSFGVPPHRYHMARRIERAKVLLAKPALSITQIAFDLGFGETSSFTAAFRRLVGRTPSSYRRSFA